MTMVYFALIAGSLFYMARIFLEYREYELKAQFDIDNLDAQITSLNAQIAAEMPLLEAQKTQVAMLREAREDLTVKLEVAKGEYKAEQMRYRLLSLELQKRQFRGVIARGRQLVAR